MGLRFGNVYAKTIDELLIHTAKRKDGIVRWRHPKRPVMSKLFFGSDFTALENPADPSEQNTLLRYMGLAAGLMERIVSHDIRRGTLRDIAYSPMRMLGVDTSASKIVAGHSNMSDANGTTREYVGELQEKTWNQRAEAPFHDHLAPEFGDIIPTALLHNRRVDVDNYMIVEDMDLSDPKARYMATKRLRKQRIENRRATASQDTSPFLLPTPSASDRRTEKARIGHGFTLVYDPTGDDHWRLNTPLAAETSTSAANLNNEKMSSQVQFSVQNSSTLATRSITGPIDASLNLIEPELSMTPDNGSDDNADDSADDSAADEDWDEDWDDTKPISIQATHSVNSHESPGDVDEEFGKFDEQYGDSDAEFGDVGEESGDSESFILLKILDSHDHESTPLYLDSDNFIDWFSKINVYRGKPDTDTEPVAVGNSRSEPSQFMYYCGIRDCIYQVSSLNRMRHHQLTC
ncbi:hypothetical protein MMC14_005272 [Varicellaria rhodocarpa]|nr:hypothetical protein [Varicellaria rhodocarpa]